jgi:hypothetical protein
MDAQNAPTAAWKTAQNAVSHNRPHLSHFLDEETGTRITNQNGATTTVQIYAVSADR